MAWILLILIAFLLGGYAFLIESYRKWFLRIKPFTLPESSVPTTAFSIIIPARNEELQIKQCLETVMKQKYPARLFEVIVINDHSSDNTVSIIEEVQRAYENLRLFHLHDLLKGHQVNSYKKKAIELAVQQAKGDWIITTDADCVVTGDWLSYFNGFINEEEVVLVAAPVKFKNTGSFLSVFQCLDFMSLQGITAAAVTNNFHSMCNGANLAYSKRAFSEVGGFAGIDSIASGDDMLLMHKIASKYPGKIKFLLSPRVIVETFPMRAWGQFFNQRIRWASKAESYDDKRIFRVLLAVYFLNLFLAALPLAALWFPVFLLYWLLLIAAKTVIELRFMRPVAKFFNEERILKWFPVMQPVHIAYTVVAGWLGKFGSYRWKERIVK